MDSLEDFIVVEKDCLESSITPQFSIEECKDKEDCKDNMCQEDNCGLSEKYMITPELNSDELADLLDEPEEDLSSHLDEQPKQFDENAMKELLGEKTWNEVSKDRDVQRFLNNDNPMDAMRRIIQRLPRKEQKRIQKLIQKKMRDEGIETPQMPEVPKKEIVRKPKKLSVLQRQSLIASEVERDPKVEPYNLNETYMTYDTILKCRKTSRGDYGPVTGIETFNNIRFTQEHERHGKNRLASSIIGKTVFGDVKIIKE